MGVLDTIMTGFGNMGRVVSDSVTNTQPVGGYQFEANREGGDQGFGGGGAGGRGEPQFRMDESGMSMEQVIPAAEPVHVFQDAAQVAEAAVPAATTGYFNQASESGAVSESAFPTDTSAPLSQTFLDTYVPEARIAAQAGYLTGDRGDTKTAVIEREYGYSPIQALSVQLESSKAEDKARGIAGDSKITTYYQNELDKAKQDIRLGADVESYEKAKSGIAQAPNTLDYAADLATTSLWRSQGVSNVPGSIRDEYGALKPEFKPFTGNTLIDANVITKAMRTGDMGPYGTLGKPFSSAYGTLDLDTQQAISRQAAKTAGWNYEAEGVANPVRAKYENPVVLEGRGLNMFYKEATIKGISPDLLSTKDDLSKTAERAAQLALTKPSSAYVNFAAASEVVSPVIQGPNEGKGNVRSIQSIQNMPVVRVPDADRFSTGVVNFDKFSKVTEPRGEQVSIVDAEMRKTGVYVPGIPGLAEGGRLGGGKTVGGHTLDNVGILPLYRPPGMGPLTLFGSPTARRSYRTFPFIRRKHTSKSSSRMVYHEPKSDPKIFNLEAINKNIMPKSLGADLFKFNLNSTDKLVKTIGVRTRVQETVKIKGDAVGLDQIKNITGNIHVSDFGTRFAQGKGGVSAVSGNINALVKNMLNPVKIRKIKSR